MDNKIVSDEELNAMFRGKDFGELINNSVYEKRKSLHQFLVNVHDDCRVSFVTTSMLVDAGLADHSWLEVPRKDSLGRLSIDKWKLLLTQKGIDFIEQELEKDSDNG